jgi:hypothetical protein
MPMFLKNISHYNMMVVGALCRQASSFCQADAAQAAVLLSQSIEPRPQIVSWNCALLMLSRGWLVLLSRSWIMVSPLLGEMFWPDALSGALP